MALFRRRRPSVPDDDGSDEDLTRAVQERIDELAVPCVAIRPGPLAVSPTTSFVGGHGYLPHGVDWPVLDDRPAAFVGQVNFAEVPALPGLPREGLLQWFVADDDTLGLTFDESAGATGFVVRWYDDLVAPSQQPATAAPPRADDESMDVAFDVPPGTSLLFEPGRDLPAWDELSPAQQTDPLWSDWAVQVGEDPEDVSFVYEEYVRGASTPDESLVQGSRIGGSATFVQDDPRGSAAYPAADAPAGRLLIELAEDLGGWGDAGIGHLFGDPHRLADGDLSTITYHWDCS